MFESRCLIVLERNTSSPYSKPVRLQVPRSVYAAVPGRNKFRPSQDSTARQTGCDWIDSNRRNKFFAVKRREGTLFETQKSCCVFFCFKIESL